MRYTILEATAMVTIPIQVLDKLARSGDASFRISTLLSDSENHIIFKSNRKFLRFRCCLSYPAAKNSFKPNYHILSCSRTSRFKDRSLTVGCNHTAVLPPPACLVLLPSFRPALYPLLPPGLLCTPSYLVWLPLRFFFIDKNDDIQKFLKLKLFSFFASTWSWWR